MPPKLDNVQKLLAAEEKRNGLIADAKRRKQEKVRLAKVDAESEVAAFRKEKESEYTAYRAQQMAIADSENALQEKETNKQLEELNLLTSKRIEAVAEKMRDHIIAVSV